MILKRVIHIIVLGFALLVAAPMSAWAQNLESSVIEAADLSAGQKDAIKQFVDRHKDGLSEGPAEVKRSRGAIIGALQQYPKVSVAFRLEYARLLTPVLRALASGDREMNAINAVRLAGELATSSGIEILNDAMNDKRPGVRFAAVDGFAATFGAIETTAPAIAPAQQAIRAVGTLKTGMDKEADAKVLEAYTLALRAATKVPSAKLAGVRPAAIKALAEGIITKAKATNDGKFDAAFRRAVNTTREALTVQSINEPKLERDVFQAAARMAGQLLANVHRRIAAGELAVEDAEAAKRSRAEFVLMAADAESTIQWANTGLGGPASQELKLSELLQQSKEETFQKDVLRLIGPNGILTTDPFGSKDENEYVK